MDEHTAGLQAILGEVIRTIEQAGIRVWFYGGHAIDALEGSVLRRHDDIDLILDIADQDRLRETMLAAGFEIRNSGEHYTFFTKRGHVVECITFSKWPDGQYITDTGETGAFPWPVTSFPDEPNGVLLGTPVRVMSYDGLYVFKAGYSAYNPLRPLRPKDAADLEIIRARVPEARQTELVGYFDPLPGTRQRYPTEDE